MVGRVRKRETFSGFLYGILLWLTLSANCNGDNQTTLFLSDMHRQAQELFNESIREHNLSMEDCQKTFRDGTIRTLNHTLDRIKETLRNFIKAFDVLYERHTVEDKHTDMLKEARMKSEGLCIHLVKWSNYSIDNLLNPHMRKVLKTKLKQPFKKDIYGQKLECCQLLYSYKEFLDVVHKINQKISTRRSKRHFRMKKGKRPPTNYT